MEVLSTTGRGSGGSVGSLPATPSVLHMKRTSRFHLELLGRQRSVTIEQPTPALVVVVSHARQRPRQLALAGGKLFAVAPHAVEHPGTDEAVHAPERDAIALSHAIDLVFANGVEPLRRLGLLVRSEHAEEPVHPHKLRPRSHKPA